jgi:hypothetical protein
LARTQQTQVQSVNNAVQAGQKYVKVTDDVADALSNASEKFKFSLLEISRMASLESSFNPNVKNSSGYMGLFQFKGAASKETGLTGKEYDPITGHKINYDKRTSDGRPLHDHMMEDKMWGEIRRMAPTNPALQKALDRAIMIYRLSKDNPQ